MNKILPMVMILLILALAACRGGGPGDEVRPTPISAPAAAEGGGSAEEGGGVGQDITVRLWVHDNQHFNEAYQSLADDYMARNPDVAVVFESFNPDSYDQILLPNASADIDIVQLPGGAVCGVRDRLAPVPEYVILPADAQAMFAPAALDGYICDEVLYGLPQEATTPWGLTVTRDSKAQEIAWDFVRFIALEPGNMTSWNLATGTTPPVRTTDADH